MNKNEFDVFEDPDDEIINEIAANYPVLSDEEKERMFSMSERKYNINNNMNNENNGDIVSGVDRYTKPVWHRYAAIAATFVLLAGGIGGSIALGKHMDKNKKNDSDMLTATTTAITTESVQTTSAENITATNAQIVTDATIAEIVTSASTETTDVSDTTETTTVTTDDRRNPSDLAAFAEEWKDKYEEYIWKISCGAVEHEDNTVSFRMTDVTGNQAEIEAWKVTDEKFSSADAIYEFMRSVWAPGTYDEFIIPDLTDKIDGGTAAHEDFIKNVLFTYKNELYRVASHTGIEGKRDNLSAEKLNDNEILVHWTLGYEGAGDEQSLHLVWVDEYNDWRIDDLVTGKYFGKPTKEEAEAIAKEMLDGLMDVNNAMYGIGVKYDENDKIEFAIHSDNPSDGEWNISYVKVTDSRFSGIDGIKAYFYKKYLNTSEVLSNVIGGDISKYPTGYSFNLNAEYKEGTDNAYINLKNYIMYNGSLYLRYDCLHTQFWGVQNVSEYARMKNDPKITSVKVSDGNMIVVRADDETDKEGKLSREYFITRYTNDEWKIQTIATLSK